MTAANKDRNIDRIAARFAELNAAKNGAGRGGLVTFITAGDPNANVSAEILRGLPAAGADLIELGMPFSDPAADGPAIEAASVRALASGMTLKGVLAMVGDFRGHDNETPIILMGYFNPIHHYGIEAFVTDAREAGVDGLIIVDLPPEEEAELSDPACEAGIHVVRLVAPTSGDQRLPRLMETAGGFVYYVAIAGITGAAGASEADTAAAVARLKEHTDLPVAVGFGIKTPDNAAKIAAVADAAVVGTAIVQRIAEGLDDDGNAAPGLADKVLDFVRQLAEAVRA